MKTRTELIVQLCTPTLSRPDLSFAEFNLLAAKLDIIAEALAIILEAARPSTEKP